ncbi:ATP-binding cassette domain-containing protein [Halorhabdus sp. CBA1104]|uniref:ATP-binding cassette domain-containing protein n=1 Tax=unclassified Halorhabdus TaxID=2621901 RepID=UPI0012B2BEE7|nr:MULTISPECIES: ATP-binding cassette domain-containing protein [unclassified Halorhabdus]QGN07293.1 ATP-binding cassette domain-containing protein [Halorhabdus sp. CBA1104]
MSEPPQTEPTIVLEDISLSLGAVDVLESVSLAVEKGQFLGLVGPNGAGKTTLLRTLNGVFEPDEGRVNLDGDRIDRLDSQAVARRVATVPQDTSVAFEFTVEDVVRMGRTPYRSRTDIVADDDDHDAVEDALARTEMCDLRERPITEVSGGERQRAYVARALAQETPALVLDEPTASLDINHQVRVLELVEDLVAGGTTAVAAIHDLDLAARYCDRLALLSDGQLQAVGDPETVLTDDNLQPAFDTQTAVTPDVVTGTPNVTAIAEPARDRGTQVHVLGCGATAARVLTKLWQAGFEVTVGPLPSGDAALSVARELGIDAIETPPLSGPDERALTDTREYCRQARATVLADPVIGADEHVLDLAEASDRSIFLERRPVAERNRAGEGARRRYRDLKSEATTATVHGLVPAITEATTAKAVPADD